MGSREVPCKKKVQGKLPAVTLGPGHPTALPVDVEEEVASCLKVLAEWGFGITTSELSYIIADFCNQTKLKTPFKDNIPGVDWFRGFKKRHPDLSERLPEQLPASRARSLTKDVKDKWFKLLDETLTELDLKDKPHLIYNVDESGLPLDPSRLKIICKKGLKRLYRIIGGSGRDSITVQGCASAAGDIMPPYIVYSGKNLYQAWTVGGVQGSRYNTSSNGWMETDVYLDWFEHHFIPNLPAVRPVLLIFDGHASHVGIKVLRLARENRITLLRLPSHSTHHLQPLDVGVYGPAKTEWEKILIEDARKTLG